MFRLHGSRQGVTARSQLRRCTVSVRTGQVLRRVLRYGGQERAVWEEGELTNSVFGIETPDGKQSTSWVFMTQ